MPPAPSADPHFPTLHRVHRRGWLNDPNGIVRHDGRWHVFFQHNPDSARHHMIRWGHVSSPDLVTWREEPMGPVPRAGEFDAEGCWSGVATIRDGRVHLVYSGVSGEDHALSRVVVQAGTDDLTAWEPHPGTVADVPPEPGIVGVRDPFLLELDGRPLAIQGAGLRRPAPDGTERTVPALLAWDATDLHDWRYLGVVLTGEDPIAAEHAPANLWECPQLVRLVDETTGEPAWVATLGRWTEQADGEATLDGVGYVVGELTWDETAHCPRFAPVAGGTVDAGPDFYAPQAFVDPSDGRVLLWGWSWEGKARTAEQTDAQGWAGCLTLPRELALVEGRLVSRTPAELRALRGDALAVRNGAIDLPYPARAEVRGEDGVRIELVEADGNLVTMIAEHSDGPASVLLDASILELLPERGVPQTVRVYPAEGQSLRVSSPASADGNQLEGWELRESVR